MLHPCKQQCVNQLIKNVEQRCDELSVDNDSALYSIVHLDKAQLSEIIEQIIMLLPDKFFYGTQKARLYDLLKFISDKFIQFQSEHYQQEPNYKQQLNQFIHQLTIDIYQQYTLCRKCII